MKIGKYDIQLLYNGYAHFELRERLGGDPFSALFPYEKDDDGNAKRNENGNIVYSPMTLDRFNSICQALSVMSSQYEIQRRTEGYDPQDIPSLTYIKTHLKPTQVSEATIEIMTAISDGMKQENEPDEVDLGLVELQKKTVE